MSSRNRKVFIGGGVLVGAVAVTVLLLVVRGHGGREQGGPVRVGEKNSVGITAPVAKQFAFGLPIVFNAGDEAATLEQVRLVEPSPGLRVERLYVAGSNRKMDAESFLREWPSKRLQDLAPLAGFRLAPESERTGERGAELVFVLRVRKEGRYTMRGAELDYKVGGKHYRRTIPSSLAVCAMDKPIRELEKVFCDSPPSARGGV